MIETFTAVGWLTVLATSAVIAPCFMINRHYAYTRTPLAREDAWFPGTPPEVDEAGAPGRPDPAQPTAMLLVGKRRGASMYALLWGNRLFPGHFRNVIFRAVGEVDAKAYDGHEHLERLRRPIAESLDYDVAHCRRNGIAADYRIAFGTNPVVEFMNLASSTFDAYPNGVCFASKPIFRRVRFPAAWLHNQTPVELQARLRAEGRQMVLLPMNVGWRRVGRDARHPLHRTS